MGERVSRSRASSSGEATSRQRGTKGSSTTAAACGSTSRSRAALGRDNPVRASWDTARTGGPNPSAATHGAARVARINDSPVLRHTSTSTPRPVNTPRSRPPTAAATVEVPTPPPTPATHGARIIGTPRRLGAAADDADGAVVVSSSRTRVDRRTRAQEPSESGELSTTGAVVLPKGTMPRHAPRAGAPRRFQRRFTTTDEHRSVPDGSAVGRSARRSSAMTGAGIWKTPPLTGASSARQPHETPSDQHRNHPVAGHDQAGEPEPGRTGESEGAAS